MVIEHFDKVLHFILGSVIGAIWSLQGGIISGIIVGSIFGIGKELYDFLHPKKHTCDWLDALATIVGSIIGSGLIWMMS